MSSPGQPTEGRETAIIYNVTSKVDQGISAAWLKWIREVHIAELVDTGCFTHAIILRLLETDDTDGPTYAVQYHARSKALYNQYITRYSQDMQQKSTALWGNKVISFRSVLQVEASG